jgi:hypothetical protein
MPDPTTRVVLADSPGVTVIEVEHAQLPAAAHPEALAAVQTLVDRFEAPYTSGVPKDELWFSWIPLRLELFFDGVLAAREQLATDRPRSRPSFLDVGSGLGSKCALAHDLGFDSHGIERHEPYLDVCWCLFPYVHAYLEDAETFDGYGAFDLVYSYGVAASIEHQAHIHRRIAEQMRRGAILFAPRSLDAGTDLEPTGHCLWRKL